MVVPADDGHADDGALTTQDDPTPDEQDARPAARRRPGRLGLAVGALALVVVALLVTDGLLLRDRTVDLGPVSFESSATKDAQEREAIRKVAADFIRVSGTYGPDDLSSGDKLTAFRAAVPKLITPKLRAEFESDAAIAEELVKQSKVDRVTTVFNAGVVTQDVDSATALVAGETTDTYPRSTTPSNVALRITLDLVKTDGRWYVDSFAPVVDGQ